MMNAFKAYASRALNRSEPDGASKTRWTRHGSTRWLWDRAHVNAAVEYVVKGQGESMAVFLADWTDVQDRLGIHRSLTVAAPFLSDFQSEPRTVGQNQLAFLYQHAVVPVVANQQVAVRDRRSPPAGSTAPRR